MVHGSDAPPRPTFENAAECPEGPIALLEPDPGLPGAPRGPGPAPADASRTGLSDVFRTWWPLATSWLLMGFELPVLSAVMARLPLPTISLAAYGGVVFPLALLIESPIIMLLSASTALSKDTASHRLVGRFMWTAGLGFTLLHVLVAFTPLYDVVVGGILGAPEPIREPARLGLMIMTPWTIAIAFRRYSQGLLIRFGRAKLVGMGSAVRLSTLALVLTAGAAYGRLPGIVVGTMAVVSSVVAEAIFAGLCARPVEKGLLPLAPAVDPPLTQKRFLAFYVPLMLTPLIAFLAMPLSSAAISRMPRALESLAVWPALTGLVFTLRSVGFALNEVVVSMLERPGAAPALRRFTGILAASTSGILLVLAVTPLGRAWFGHVAGLPPALVALATIGLLFSIPMPGLSAIQSLFQGTLVHEHRTRGVTESVAVLLLVTGAVLAAGVWFGRVTGLYVGLIAFALGNGAQAGWLMARARGRGRVLAAALLLLALGACGPPAVGGRATGRDEPDTLAYFTRSIHHQTVRTVPGDEPAMRIEFDYPVFTHVPGADTLALNREIRRRINGGLLEASSRLDADPDSVAAARVAEFEQPDGDDWGGYEESSIEVLSFRTALLSLSFGGSGYSGGAHPNAALGYVNLDPRTAAEVPIDSIFARGTSDALVAAAERAFRRAREIAPDSSLTAAGFTFEGGRFYLTMNAGLTHEGLAFHYNSYEIAPYSDGPTDAVIPWSELEPLVRPEYRPQAP
jgi:hypothetical protein